MFYRCTAGDVKIGIIFVSWAGKQHVKETGRGKVGKRSEGRNVGTARRYFRGDFGLFLAILMRVWVMCADLALPVVVAWCRGRENKCVGNAWFCLVLR